MSTDREGLHCSKGEACAQTIFSTVSICHFVRSVPRPWRECGRATRVVTSPLSQHQEPGTTANTRAKRNSE